MTLDYVSPVDRCYVIAGCVITLLPVDRIVVRHYCVTFRSIVGTLLPVPVDCTVTMRYYDVAG